MKKTLVLALAFAFLCSTAYSQEKKHELSVGVGLLGDVQLVTVLADAIGTIATLGYGIEPGDKYSIITPHINYRYNLVKWFSLGATFNFDSNNVFIARDLDGNGSMETNEWADKVEYNRYYYTLAIESVFNYMNKPNMRIYGLLGFGGTITNAPGFENFQTTVIPNFQINPFGMSFGDKVVGYFEVGYGYKGIINAGVAYRF